MEEDSENDESAPAEITETVQVTSLRFVPETTRKRYEFAYDQFMEWRKKNDIKTSFSENVLLAYMQEISKKLKPTTLCTQYSMLRSTLFTNHNVDISRYIKLKALLKGISVGYKPQKAKSLTAQDVHEFIVTAPDEKYLFAKVALIFGISGACRKQELVQLAVDNIEDMNSTAFVKIEDTTNKTSRRFKITGIYYDMYKKYANLRPETTEKRFFLNYQNGKCTRQVVGINKIGAVAKTVASFLKLTNPESYTGHSFRRLSATILGDEGKVMTTPTKHEIFKTEPLEGEYLEESCENIKRE